MNTTAFATLPNFSVMVASKKELFLIPPSHESEIQEDPKFFKKTLERFPHTILVDSSLLSLNTIFFILLKGRGPKRDSAKG
jgi:hypothetical protein